MAPKSKLKVSITSPVSGASVFDGPLLVTGLASSNRTVTSVRVRVGSGAWVNAQGTSSWQATVTIPSVLGSVTVTAEAVDATGVRASTTVTLTVIAQDVTPPTITIISPAAGDTVTGKIPVGGTASDTVGLSLVEISVDSGNWVTASGTATWSYTLDTSSLSSGNHTIYARATDSSGNQTTTSVTVSVIAVPVSVYPDSYFAGPLGADNIVPDRSSVDAGYLLGMYAGKGGLTASQQRAFLQQRMTDSGRTFDCVTTHIGGTGSQLANSDTYAVSGVLGETWIHSLGSIPLVTWSPNWAPADVAAGTHDADLNQVATRLGASGFRIMLRLWREQNSQSGQLYFTGDSSKTSAQLAQIAADWIAGWRYIVNYFQAHGATNVGFCWCPSELANRANTVGFTGRDQLAATYPGDAYVDWVGIDRYNRGLAGGFSTPLHNGWAEFDEIFNYHTGHALNLPAISDEYGPRKPIYIWETGSKYDNSSGQSTRKADWHRRIDTVTANPSNSKHIPYLHGVQFFDQWVPAESNDWNVDTDQVKTGDAEGTPDATTYQGWKDLAATARANVGAIGGAT